MIYQTTKDRIETLRQRYQALAGQQPQGVYEIAIAEIPEMVYNSNAIENSTLTLKDTEDIILRDMIKKDADIREVYEAKNLAGITTLLVNNPRQPLTVGLILQLHRTLLAGINDAIAGRFRRKHEWVRVGTHLGAHPEFAGELVAELVKKYHADTDSYFLDNIARFHAEFETIHPFCDGNGRMGRVLINLQLLALGWPPIIIQNKGKRTDYYPLFDEYATRDKFDGFTNLFALALLESLHKRVAILSGAKIVPLNFWAKQGGVNVSAVLNKAKRQTIPAFRMRGEWMIAADAQAMPVVKNDD